MKFLIMKVTLNPKTNVGFTVTHKTFYLEAHTHTHTHTHRERERERKTEREREREIEGGGSTVLNIKSPSPSPLEHPRFDSRHWQCVPYLFPHTETVFQGVKIM